MKSIIIISTMLFVTASFVGIGNYMRYNDSLRQKGLYAEAAESHTTTDAISEENTPIHTDTTTNDQLSPKKEEKQDLPGEDQENNLHQQNQTNRGKKSSKQQKPVVLHAAKKPLDREIDFKDFSRAPLTDYPRAAVSEEAAAETVVEPAVISEAEE